MVNRAAAKVFLLRTMFFSKIILSAGSKNDQKRKGIERAMIIGGKTVQL